MSSAATSKFVEPDPARVLLIAADGKLRASISHGAQQAGFSLEPIASIAEITLREYTTAHVLIVWDEGDIVEQLKAQLAIIGSWVPVIAMSERPPVERVVQALVSGAVNYVDWRGDLKPLAEAVRAASEARAKHLPRRLRQAESRRLLGTLSKRERQVLVAVTQGLSNKEAAKVLGISDRTVEIHRANMMRKLEASHTADAVRIALESSIVPDWIRSESCAAPWSFDDPLLAHLELGSD